MTGRRRILVIGSLPGFAEAFAQLEERDFGFEYLADTGTARNDRLRQEFDVVLLTLPRGEAERETAMAWLYTNGGELPVVVLSSEADTRPYLAAMECGAFDYLTSQTPLAEVERVLANAVRWREQQAA